MVKVFQVPQHKLSDECWLIQVYGRDACKTCTARGTSKCGGQNILRTGKNSKGHKIPVAEAIK